MTSASPCMSSPRGPGGSRGYVTPSPWAGGGSGGGGAGQRRADRHVGLDEPLELGVAAAAAAAGPAQGGHLGDAGGSGDHAGGRRPVRDAAAGADDHATPPTTSSGAPAATSRVAVAIDTGTVCGYRCRTPVTSA